MGSEMCIRDRNHFILDFPDQVQHEYPPFIFQHCSISFALVDGYDIGFGEKIRVFLLLLAFIQKNKQRFFEIRASILKFEQLRDKAVWVLSFAILQPF